MTVKSLLNRLPALNPFRRQTPAAEPVADTTQTRTPLRAQPATGTVSAPPFLRFSTEEKVLFAKRLSFLVRAGVSLVESMTMIRNQTRSKRKQKIFDTIIADITAGQYLSKSLERYPQLFGTYTINLIRVGETAGVLSENLTYLADELSKKQALERKVRSALVYPIFITIATLGVTGMLVVFIFPKIMPIFVSLNIELPLTTRVLLAVSEYLKAHGVVTILGTAGVIALVAVAHKLVPLARTALDWLLLRLPIVGPIARLYNAANFCRTLGLTIRAGIVPSEAMHVTADVTQNIIYQRAYRDAAAHIVRGEKISTALSKRHGIFPDILPHMVLIGETTGSLSNTLSYLAELYESEVDERTKNLSNSIEPILLVVMGLLVGLIAVSVITPIYEVTRHISNMN